MNANQLAEMLECLGWRSVDANLREAAAMLRRQHEAIVKLREALDAIAENAACPGAVACAIVALKDTEEFQ